MATKPTKNVYAVATEYGTFTRSSFHVYTHVVVACGYNDDYIRQLIAETERKQAAGKLCNASHLDYLRNKLAASADTKARNAGLALTWSHSLRNAEKAAASWRKDYNVVGIFPTTPEWNDLKGGARQ